MKKLKKSLLICSFLIVASNSINAQINDTTSLSLDSVIVSAFEQNKPILEIPSPVQYISKKDIERFDNQNVNQVLNQYPGIRIEERSPGSYRIAIRGSSLRSPFGVRNVKVYWNNIPLTDATGNTYFNLQDINTINSIEVLKGPSGSMYGAGIGGVLLLDPKTATAQNGKQNEIQANVLVGSYGTFNRSIAMRRADSKINSILSYNGTSTKGYREHSEFKRESLQWQSSFFLKPNYTISLLTQFTSLDYETPLGLTEDLALENPRQARPGNRFVSGAVEQDAGIKQKMLNLGLTQEWEISQNFTSKLSLFGNSSNLENPFITNYEDRAQTTLGTRLTNTFRYGKQENILNFGLEWQSTESVFEVYDNNSGNKGNLRFTENVDASQGLFFLQSENPLPFGTLLTLGVSANFQQYDYLRNNSAGNLEDDFKNNSSVPLVPRVGLSKKLGPLYVFGTYSKGFSPPTVSEIIDSFDPLSSIVTPLEAETADNFEAGLKSQFWQSKAYLEVNGYHQQMRNAIVRRFNDLEDQIFTNEGNIKQIGLEVYSKAQLNKLLRASISLNWTDYTFFDYEDNGENFSGNKVPSVPNFQGNFALDLNLPNGVFLNTNSNYTSSIFLNNDNTVASDPFWLVNTRAGYKRSFKQYTLKIFAGVNNLLDSFYGAGNDVNAFGNRFFNPSPGRTFNSGIDLSVHF